MGARKTGGLAVVAVLVLIACSTEEGPAPAGQAREALDGRERHIVVFSRPSAGRAALVAAGGSVLLELPGRSAVAANLSAAAAAGLARNPAVSLVELDPPRYPQAQESPYGVGAVQALDAELRAAAGASTDPPLVCIIDSGLETGHEDLPSSLVTGEPAGWSEDTCGHGSHVAGTIAALDNAAGVLGVHPGGLPIHAVQVFDGADCGWSYASGLVAALDACRAAAANRGLAHLVVNMSLGGGIKSRFEQAAFDDAERGGVLSIAAAGNDGNTRRSYPASYSSVVSVAAVDESSEVASFSQQNSAVELAAPGVSVLSTVPWRSANTITVSGIAYDGAALEGAPEGLVSGPVVDGGTCNAAPAAGAFADAVVLCERGDATFADKVSNAEAGGAAAAVVYNNEPGLFLGTLGDSTSSIPAISLSQADGQHLVSSELGQSATVESVFDPAGSGYERWDGTSMATPHVSGVAALLWSAEPAASAAEIRDALGATALDLGDPGRDNAFGFGLVQARDAFDFLMYPQTCTPEPELCTDGADNDCDGLVDCDDDSCDGDAACSGGGGDPVCLDLGQSCSSSGDCCSGRCRGRGGNKSCV